MGILQPSFGALDTSTFPEDLEKKKRRRRGKLRRNAV
jgi:hypothetical protein